MPTIPLYDTSAHPDGWHRVTAPGGGELWHLEAEDPAHAIRVEVILVEGDQRNRDYLRAYRAYRRRPTRVPPPLPRDFPCVQVLVSENGQTRWGLDVPQPPGSLRGGPGLPEIALGPCVLCSAGDGGGVRLSIQPPAQTGQTVFEGELTFRPAVQQADLWYEVVVLESRLVYRRRPDADYEVSGTLRERGGAVGEPRRTIEFRGRGRYAHLLATGRVLYP